MPNRPENDFDIPPITAAVMELLKVWIGGAPNSDAVIKRRKALRVQLDALGIRYAKQAVTVGHLKCLTLFLAGNIDLA